MPTETKYRFLLLGLGFIFASGAEASVVLGDRTDPLSELSRARKPRHVSQALKKHLGTDAIAADTEQPVGAFVTSLTDAELSRLVPKAQKALLWRSPLSYLRNRVGGYDGFPPLPRDVLPLWLDVTTERAYHDYWRARAPFSLLPGALLAWGGIFTGIAGIYLQDPTLLSLGGSALLSGIAGAGLGNTLSPPDSVRKAREKEAVRTAAVVIERHEREKIPVSTWSWYTLKGLPVCTYYIRELGPEARHRRRGW